jgi:protein-S-isoprenylcysteine O-methyltransferase Ste14
MLASGPAAALVFAWGGAVVFALSLLFCAYAYLVPFGRVLHDGSVLGPVISDVTLFAGFALHHSLLARSATKARVRELIPPSLERSVYIWTASVLFIIVCALWRPVPGELYHVSGHGAWIGHAVQLLGIVVTIRSAARLDVLDLAGVRPVMDPPRLERGDHVPLETAGWYGFVRHPVYFAWVLMVFGAPHMTMTRVVFAATSTIYLVVAIPFEERTLVHVFGDEYRAYQQRVRWRMLPGIY